ncbi:hypothetical protein VIBNIFTn2_120146 [Vibrio nigripulchritudo FTn2]|nr:hypothetical protein VIBNIFTn2_120146 [Vibrio nigripulchritudo FTn2]
MPSIRSVNSTFRIIGSYFLLKSLRQLLRAIFPSESMKKNGLNRVKITAVIARMSVKTKAVI